MILNFNPRAPYGARHTLCLDKVIVNLISIHAPHTGRDPMHETSTPFHTDFNPRAPYGARRIVSVYQFLNDFISIHAPHTGRDLYQP